MEHGVLREEVSDDIRVLSTFVYRFQMLLLVSVFFIYLRLTLHLEKPNLRQLCISFPRTCIFLTLCLEFLKALK